MTRSLLAGLLLLPGLCLAGTITLTDDTGAPVRLPAPASRIVALAPHLVENLFLIGAGPQIVGAVDYSDHPPPAQQIPRVGSFERFDVEQILVKKPDLIVGWATGNPAAQIDKLRLLGVPIYLSQPNRFEDVAHEIRQLGRLIGQSQAADAAADQFMQRLDRLRRTNEKKPRVGVFYQIWQTPLMTVGGGQIISSAITACGGENVFASIRAMAAQVSEESVIAADAEAFIAGGMGEVRKDWLEYWRRWKNLTAVKRDNLFFVHADLMQRHTPRLLDGAEQLCAHLDTARARRGK